jgi:hypothetical protein
LCSGSSAPSQVEDAHSTWLKNVSSLPKSVHDVILVVEGNSNFGAYANEIRNNYVVPTLE